MLNWLTNQIPSRPLGLVRVIVGAAALFRSVVAFGVLSDVADPGIVDVPYLDWTPAPTLSLAIGILSVWAVSAVLFMIGWRVALSGSALLLAIVSTLALEQQAYSNHLYLMAWLVLLLVIADAGAGLNVARTNRPVIRWTVLLLMLQLSVVYGFSSLTKINDEFLSGMVLAGVMREGVLSFPETLRTPAFLSSLALVVVAIELLLALGIWFRKARPAVFVAGLGFHIAITLFMSSTVELFIFSIEMLALYPLFLTQESLVVVWDDECDSCFDWVSRFRRFDVLKTLHVVGKSSDSNPIPAEEVERSLHLIHQGETTSGFKAVTGVLEHLVPTSWFASILRVPGISHLAERWYRWQAARRSCPVALRSPVTP